ncbi:MAG: class I mannose-6-phosphate isomerase [Muribaculaceae bacterium]|nr:class I mannose-6-phosphate isomerase [Muribaculaceae bacterium]
MWKFRPILKETLWGGDKIARLKGLPAAPLRLGESWELACMPDSVSVVADGPDAGMSLLELIEREGSDLLGERNETRFGPVFPLLIKFIEACSDLSIQVHPDDATALRHGLPNGKAEMWYVLEADPGARIANGFSRTIDKAELHELVKTGKIEESLNYLDVKPGEVFFIPPGRVHAIGRGTMVVEIQQSSDATYRIYDYGRRDPKGQLRELHTDKACEALDFRGVEVAPSPYTSRPDIPVNLVRNNFFTANLLRLSDQLMRDYSELDSFVAVVATEGEATLRTRASEIKIRRGETVLVPAAANGLEITPVREFSAIEVYI